MTSLTKALTLTLGLTLAASLTVGLMLTPSALAGEAEAVRVGTYQPQQAFSQYHGTHKFRQEMQKMQAEMQNDPQQARQVQQKMQQKQQQLFSTFEADVEAAFGEMAEEIEVDLVAVEVLHKGDHVEVKDLTNPLIEKLNEGQDVPEPATAPTQPRR